MKQQKTCPSCTFVDKIIDPQNIGVVNYVCRSMPPTPCAIVTDGGVMIQSFNPPVTEKTSCSMWKNSDPIISTIK